METHVACKPGYFGKFCTLPCPIGTFGDNCAGECGPTCSDEKCDRIVGCQENVKDIIQTTSPEYLKTSYAYFSHRIHTISTYQVRQGKETGVVTEDPMTNSEFTTVYILVGLGPIVSLFLFATLMQLCKKYKKARRQIRTADDNRESCHTSSNLSSTDQSLKLSDTGYEEINDISESQQLEALNASDAYEIPRTSGRDTHLSHRNIPSCSSENGVFVEQNVEKISDDENNYLIPLFPHTLSTTENETFENEKLYIDVIV